MTKIFIDTAELGEIKEALSWGVVDGVTTNPSLIRKAVGGVKGEVSLESYVRKICKAAGEGRPVSLEVLSREADRMVGEAKILYNKFNPIATNVVIKIPVNTRTEQEATDHEGLKAINKLSAWRTPTNATLVMTPEQALLAANAGATYVSPFAGRVDDYIRKNLGIDFKKGDYFDFELVEEISKTKLNEYLARSLPLHQLDPAPLFSDAEIRKAMDIGGNRGITSGVDLVKKIVDIFRKHDIKTKVVAASMRNPQQVREVAETGCEIATIPFEVIREMLKHPKTREGVEKFYADAVQAKYGELFTKSGY